MKSTIKILLIAICVSFVGETSAQTVDHKKMPPTEMLPKVGEVKKIYQFPHETNYRLFDTSKKVLASGKAEFFDMSPYKDGVYYMEYTKLDGDIILDKFTKETPK